MLPDVESRWQDATTASFDLSCFSTIKQADCLGEIKACLYSSALYHFIVISWAMLIVQNSVVFFKKSFTISCTLNRPHIKNTWTGARRDPALYWSHAAPHTMGWAWLFTSPPPKKRWKCALAWLHFCFRSFLPLYLCACLCVSPRALSQYILVCGRIQHWSGKK